MAVAGGLLIAGARPIVLIQCTGLFEAGDALRNIVHDMGLPLFLVVGLRSQLAYRAGKTADTCPVYSEPIMQAWKVSYVMFDENNTADELAAEYRKAWAEQRAGAVLVME
jgi:sulfopyruvate decarboxylase TPP-binding subunit